MCGQENPCFSFVWLGGVRIRGSLQADSLLSSHNSDLCSVGLCCGQEDSLLCSQTQVFSKVCSVRCADTRKLARGFLTAFSQLLLLLKSLAKRSFNSAAKGNGSNAKVASALICAQIPSKATRHPFKTAAQGIEVTSVKNILCGGREEGVCFWLRRIFQMGMIAAGVDLHGGSNAK